MLGVYGVNLLASCLIPKLDNHPSSAVHNCLFNIYVAWHAALWWRLQYYH